ncbi:hypothetical protein K488DRAFT_67652, partial [Vararia minispora EC-137]
MTMSVRHSNSNHAPAQSLPPFSVAFSSVQAFDSNALPPIQHSHQNDMDDPSRVPKRKRPYRDREDGLPSASPPRVVRVKDEVDELADDAPYAPRVVRSAPSPPDAPPSSEPAAGPQTLSGKRRRLTVPGQSRPGFDPSNANPPNMPPANGQSAADLAPAPSGPIPEHVRANLSAVKRSQEALIDRRNSLSGPASSPRPPPSLSASAAVAVVRGPVPASRSPPAPPARLPPPPSPSRPAPPQADASHRANALPPPSISFTRRRAAAGGKNKRPADILISPRDPTQGP